MLARPGWPKPRTHQETHGRGNLSPGAGHLTPYTSTARAADAKHATTQGFSARRFVDFSSVVAPHTGLEETNGKYCAAPTGAALLG